MSTYLNTYEIVKEVRIGLNDYSSGDEKVQGVDTSGPFQNSYILNKINAAQRYLYSFIMSRTFDVFFARTTISGVDSVYTLPADFGVLEEFRDDNGYKVFNMRQNRRKTNSSTGSDRLYTRIRNTLVLDKDNVNDTYTLYYYSKPRNLDFGCAVSGTTNILQLAADFAPKIDDFFNGMMVENITSDWVDTISDYDTDRICTLTDSNVAAVNDYYGLVSELPETFHFLIPIKALLLIKGEHPNSQITLTQPELMNFNDLLISTIQTFAASTRDISMNDVFEDFDPSSSWGGYVDYD